MSLRKAGAGPGRPGKTAGLTQTPSVNVFSSIGFFRRKVQLLVKMYLFSCEDSRKHPELNPFTSLLGVCMAMLSPTFLRKDLQSDALPFLPELCASREKELSLELLVITHPKAGREGETVSIFLVKNCTQTVLNTSFSLKI